MISLLFVLLASAALPPGAVSPEQQIMDTIETSLQLPGGAHELSAYGRYYAYERRTRDVVAVYIKPPAPEPPGVGCEDLMTGKEVECPPEPNALAAGERIWLRSADELPQVLDGGCDVISLRYDTADKRVQPPVCNGTA